MPRAKDGSTRERALDALSIARRRQQDLDEIAPLVGLTPSEVLREVEAGFERRGGRWIAKPRDRIPREMTVLTAAGPRSSVIRDSRIASLVAQHHNAVRHYIETGDTSWLEPFRHRRIHVRDGPATE